MYMPNSQAEISTYTLIYIASCKQQNKKDWYIIKESYSTPDAEAKKFKITTF